VESVVEVVLEKNGCDIISMKTYRYGFLILLIVALRLYYVSKNHEKKGLKGEKAVIFMKKS